MSERETFFDRAVTAVLPLGFVGSSWLNVIAYILDGHRHEGFRMAFTWGLLACATLLMFLKVVQLFVKRPASRKWIAAAALIPAVLAFFFLWALIVNGGKRTLLGNAVIEMFLLVSAWSAVLIIALEKKWLVFLKVCRVYSVVLAPVMVYYCLRFYRPGAVYGSGPDRVDYLGMIDYMTLAYMLLFFCLCILAEMLLHRAAQEKPAVFWLDFLLFTLFSITITLSGTKGTVICLLFSAVLFAIYPLLCKQAWKPFLLYAVSAVLSVALFATVCFPSALGPNRMSSFVGELDGMEEREDYLRESIPRLEALLLRLELIGEEDARDYVSIVGNFLSDGDAETALEEERITEEEYQFLNSIYSVLNHTNTGGRLVLWTNALDEIKRAPLTGHGPMSYQVKYGTYPHNLFLELGTDFGVPAMLLILVLGIWVFLSLIRHSLAAPPVAAATLFVLGHMPQMMLSGSVYNFDVFYQCGFCILLAVFLRKHAQDCKRNMNKGKQFT